MSFGAVVYYIWKERNNIIFNKRKTTKEGITSLIKKATRERVSLLYNIERTNENIVFANMWNLPVCMFKDYS